MAENESKVHYKSIKYSYQNPPLIGLINNQSNIALKDKLPISLINSVFYYILPKLYSKEIKEIIWKKFDTFNLKDEINEFVNCFNKSRKFSHIKGNISYFSLNDITKYILFRRYTKNSLDKSIILQIIFALFAFRIFKLKWLPL